MNQILKRDGKRVKWMPAIELQQKSRGTTEKEGQGWGPRVPGRKKG